MPQALADGISRDPAILGGKPVIAGTRIPVDLVVDLFNSGATMQDFQDGYHLTAQQVQAALDFAQKVNLEGPPHVRATVNR